MADQKVVSYTDVILDEIHTLVGTLDGVVDEMHVALEMLVEQGAQFNFDDSALIEMSFNRRQIHAGIHYYLEGHVTLADAATLYAKIVVPDTACIPHLTWDIESSGILTTEFYEGATGGMAGGSRPTIHATNRGVNCWMGWHDGGDNQAVLTDSSQAWTPGALVGMQVFNQTDGSSAFITANTADTVTGVLAGGTGNDWDDDDVYEINNSQLVVTSGVTIADTLGLVVAEKMVGSEGFKAFSGGGADRIDELSLRRNTTYHRRFLSGSDANVISFRASWFELEHV